MKCLSRFLSLTILVAAAVSQLSAAPTITLIQNAASNIPPGFPNAPLAQGSIFIIKGSGLGPANIAFSPKPFQTTSVGGTSITVTVNSTVVNVLMYYASDGQVAGLLPSNTPTGAGMFAVTYNGQTSTVVAHTVTVSVPGVFTIDSSGAGSGVFTFPDYSVVSATPGPNCGGPSTACGAANPGDTLSIWATGLGPIQGDDSSGAGLGVNMTNLPVQVWVGGVQAQVIYQGRSGCCIGEDQIAFTVPANVPVGCGVPVVVQINNVVSNTTVLPVANGSRSCPLLDPSVASIDASVLHGTLPFAEVELDHLMNSPGPGFQDSAQFNFATFTVPTALQVFAGTYLSNPPLGTCGAQIITGNKAPNPIFSNVAPLDAGSTFKISGPNGSMTVNASLGQNVTLSSSGSYLTPGAYTLSGSGGKDIGPFNVTINLPALPTLTNPVNGAGLSVSRGKALNVTWTPNSSPGQVQILVTSYLNQNLGSTVACTAPISAGAFSIPPSALLALPTGTGTGTAFGFQPGDGPGPASTATFSTSGLVFGIAQTFVDGMYFGGFPITN